MLLPVLTYTCVWHPAVQRRYMDNVPAIVPLLEREHRVAESRLATSKKELDDLATDKLKVRGCKHPACQNDVQHVQGPCVHVLKLTRVISVPHGAGDPCATM
jgi:hypothetical protein